MSARPRRRVVATAVVLVVIAQLVGLEALVRIAGDPPFRAAPYRGEPRLLEPDGSLGWRNKPGRYVYPGYTPGSPPIRILVWKDGARATRPTEDGGGDVLLLLGDSWTFGSAISDEETYAWKLQRMFPRLDVRNYGTRAFGTMQCMLLLERLLQSGLRPRWVVYGFFEHHQDRNVLTPEWREALDRGARLGTVAVPYASVGADGDLLLHAPEEDRPWPLREHSALVHFLERRYRAWEMAGRAADRRRVTDLVLSRLHRLSQSAGASFLAIDLASSDEVLDHYSAALYLAGSQMLDCRVPTLGDSGSIVAVDGHPNGATHSKFAGCLARGLEPLVE